MTDAETALKAIRADHERSVHVSGRTSHQVDGSDYEQRGVTIARAILRGERDVDLSGGASGAQTFRRRDLSLPDAPHGALRKSAAVTDAEAGARAAGVAEMARCRKAGDTAKSPEYAGWLKYRHAHKGAMSWRQWQAWVGAKT